MADITPRSRHVLRVTGTQMAQRPPARTCLLLVGPGMGSSWQYTRCRSQAKSGGMGTEGSADRVFWVS